MKDRAKIARGIVISIFMPSSPGYVGTYHWSCQLSLGLFQIPKSNGLVYAQILHASDHLPSMIFGLLFGWKEGINIFRMCKKDYQDIKTV